MARESKRQIMANVCDYATAKIIANNTVEYTTTDGRTVIRLHQTDIVTTMPNGDIVLNTGGWQTVTTKERLNRYAPASIYSHNGVWIIRYAGQEYAYQDGLTIHADGQISGVGPDPNETKKLRARAKKYARGYVTALRKGQISEPSAGDCWYCALHTKDDAMPLGGPDHILAHFDESYYVPSLVLNALKRFGASRAAQHNTACALTGQFDKLYFDADFVWQGIEKCVRRWCFQELGLAV